MNRDTRLVRVIPSGILQKSVATALVAIFVLGFLGYFQYKNNMAANYGVPKEAIAQLAGSMAIDAVYIADGQRTKIIEVSCKKSRSQKPRLVCVGKTTAGDRTVIEFELQGKFGDIQIYGARYPDGRLKDANLTGVSDYLANQEIDAIFDIFKATVLEGV